MPSMREVTEAAIKALEDQRSPFHESFLIENEVTFDQVMTLSERTALGLRLVLMLADADPSILLGAVNGAHMAAAYRALNRSLEAAASSRRPAAASSAPEGNPDR